MPDSDDTSRGFAGVSFLSSGALGFEQSALKAPGPERSGSPRGIESTCASGLKVRRAVPLRGFGGLGRAGGKGSASPATAAKDSNLDMAGFPKPMAVGSRAPIRGRPALH